MIPDVNVPSIYETYVKQSQKVNCRRASHPLPAFCEHNIFFERKDVSLIHFIPITTFESYNNLAIRTNSTLISSVVGISFAKVGFSLFMMTKTSRVGKVEPQWLWLVKT